MKQDISNMKPCPCGAKPIRAKRKGKGLKWIVRCSKADCPRSPYIYKATEAEAVNAWNEEVDCRA